MITVTGLSKSYNGKKVVDDLSFTMKEGNLFALLGSNGAGKSTTIKMMLSLVKKDGGRIEIPEDALLGLELPDHLVPNGILPGDPLFSAFFNGDGGAFILWGAAENSQGKVKSGMWYAITSGGPFGGKDKDKILFQGNAPAAGPCPGNAWESFNPHFR